MASSASQILTPGVPAGPPSGGLIDANHSHVQPISWELTRRSALPGVRLSGRFSEWIRSMLYAAIQR
jgi:hypothetical protein